MAPGETAERVWTFLSEDEDARVCRDIPEAACSDQPRAFTLQLLSQVFSKLADTLGSSRVVLPWLLSAIAAPAFVIAWLLPLRESLSLLPQLLVAARLRRHPMRRGFYVAGALAQGLCMLAMPALLLLPSPGAAGLGILLLLSLFSLARGVCSVAAKDVLGKTVSKSRRGRLTGIAGSVAGAFTVGLAVALLLAGDALRDTVPLLVGMLIGAALCWCVAALTYQRVPEVPGATAGGGNALDTALESLGMLRSDATFRHFVVTRMLLVSAAFTIPYLVVAAQRESAGVGALATILLAEGLASLASSTVWGYWSDRASEQVMAAAAFLTAAVLALALWLSLASPALLGDPRAIGALLLLAAVAHQGARVGRKTYLVDIATADNRAAYVAVSNTVLGLFMLSGGALGVLDAAFGTAAVLAFLLALSVMAAFSALRLPRANDL
jgi:hypothetical protein